MHEAAEVKFQDTNYQRPIAGEILHQQKCKILTSPSRLLCENLRDA